MYRDNNKGFTLIEIIIVMTIMTTVISIGYTILNKTNSSSKEQQNIINGQSNANLINRYLTQDLEQAIEVINPTDVELDLDEYSYDIDKDSAIVKYTVKKYELNGEKYYDLIREVHENGISTGKIDIINKQARSNEQPFNIDLIDSNSNIYKVELNYKENKSEKKYEFDVSSRIMTAMNTQKPSGDLDKDDDFKNQNSFFQFGYEKLDGDNQDKIWTSAGPSGNSNNNSVPNPKQVPSNTIEHDIYIFIETNTGNGKANTIMNKQSEDSKLEATFQNNDVLKKSHDRIKVTLYGDIDVEGNIVVTYKKGNDIHKIEHKLQSYSSIYDIQKEYYNGDKQYSIEIIGKIIKPKISSLYGEVVIQVGEKNI